MPHPSGRSSSGSRTSATAGRSPMRSSRRRRPGSWVDEGPTAGCPAAAGLTEIDYHDHMAWVALDPPGPGFLGVGVGRYARPAEEPAVAEAAVTVVDHTPAER